MYPKPPPARYQRGPYQPLPPGSPHAGPTSAPPSREPSTAQWGVVGDQGQQPGGWAAQSTATAPAPDTAQASGGTDQLGGQQPPFQPAQHPGQEGLQTSFQPAQQPTPHGTQQPPIQPELQPQGQLAPQPGGLAAQQPFQPGVQQPPPPGSLAARSGGQPLQSGLQPSGIQWQQPAVGGADAGQPTQAGSFGAGTAVSQPVQTGQPAEPVPGPPAAGEWPPYAGQPTAGGQQVAQVTEPPREMAIPDVDVWDSPDEFVVLVDLPGCEPDDIVLQATDNSLHITATRRAEQAGEGSRVFQRERAERAERVIHLPADVDVDRAEASCENGVCRIRLSKVEREHQKRIGIH